MGDAEHGWGITPTGPTANVYNAKNQGSNLSYDGAGRVSSNGLTSFKYDAENRQTTVTDAPAIGGGNMTYSFDAIGQRYKSNYRAALRQCMSTMASGR